MFLRNIKKRSFTISDFFFLILFIGLVVVVFATVLWYVRNIVSDNKNIERVKIIQEGLEAYYDKNARYPDSLDEISTQDFSKNQDIFKYTPLSNNNICTGYHLGIVVGAWHRALLKNDTDFYSEKVCGSPKNKDFYGVSRGCMYTPLSENDLKDTCYDVLMKP
jgi:competence protein ComGC